MVQGRTSHVFAAETVRSHLLEAVHGAFLERRHRVLVVGGDEDHMAPATGAPGDLEPVDSYLAIVDLRVRPGQGLAVSSGWRAVARSCCAAATSINRGRNKGASAGTLTPRARRAGRDSCAELTPKTWVVRPWTFPTSACLRARQAGRQGRRGASRSCIPRGSRPSVPGTQSPRPCPGPVRPRRVRRRRAAAPAAFPR